MSAYLSVALQFAFTTFVTCAMVFFISGAYLMLFKIRYANELFKHPYLKERAFNQYSRFQNQKHGLPPMPTNC